MGWMGPCELLTAMIGGPSWWGLCWRGVGCHGDSCTFFSLQRVSTRSVEEWGGL